MNKPLIFAIAAVAMMFSGNKMSAQTSIGFYNGARSYVTTEDNEKVDDKSDAAFVGGLSLERNSRLGRFLGFSAGADIGIAAKNDFMVKDDILLETYLDIPLRLKIFIPLGKAVDLSIFAGGVPSICLSSNTKTGDEDPRKNLSDDGYQRFDVMIGGGVGLDIIKHIKLAASLDAGLLDRQKPDLIEYHSGVVKFTVAYIF